MIKRWIVPLIIGLTIYLLLAMKFGFANVSGSSMEPTLFSQEQTVFVRHTKINRFDVVIFNATGVDPKDTNGDNYVKRVIGLPGDEISYQANGTLIVNGQKVDQPFISRLAQGFDTVSIGDTVYNQGFTLQDLSIKENWPHPMTSNKIPDGYYFVMGDNRSVSNDSRYWGLVPADKIDGVAKWTTSFRTID
jgi:signal peptidase I